MAGADTGALRLERWIAWIRMWAIPFAFFQLAVSHPLHGLREWGWLVTAIFVPGAAVLLALSRRPRPAWFGALALAFDTLILSGYTLVYAHEPSSPTRQLLFVAVIEASVRYGLRGAVALAFATVPTLAGYEWLRHEAVAPLAYRWDYVTFQLGVEVIFGLVVGWLVGAIAAERLRAEARAREAEALRDELGRRGDMLDAANRCARALSSSLDLDEAFGAFIRELGALVPFDRVAIVALDGGDALTLASGGLGEEDVYRAGTREPAAGSLLPEIVESGRTIERRDIDPPRYPEEEQFLALGLRTRVGAPVYAGVRAVGMLVLSRREPGSFTPAEVELLTLLGRLVGGAVQNIRAYDAERKTVEELRRLSALRADFVSLVSHELRSPMAAVIGSARTLQQRWRELAPEQRDSFLALIADETARLAELVGDVLDTSRIEAGSFPYHFADVDVEELLREAVATAEAGQDEVPVALHLAEPLPPVRADPARLRQVLGNLLDNAVKYSPHGRPVEVRAAVRGERLSISVRDEGPGIERDQQQVIFEKFGRANGSSGKPGTGLGLFIARSIAEAHGGRIDLVSEAGRGSTFTLVLPLGR